MQKHLTITTERVVTENAEIALRIKKIDSLSRSDLPTPYLEGVPRFVPSSYGYSLVTSEFTESIFLDEVFTVERWSQLLPHIEAAGKRLNEINAKRRSVAKFWKGEVVFII